MDFFRPPPSPRAEEKVWSVPKRPLTSARAAARVGGGLYRHLLERPRDLPRLVHRSGQLKRPAVAAEDAAAADDRAAEGTAAVDAPASNRRHCMLAGATAATEERLDCGYKECTLPAALSGAPRPTPAPRWRALSSAASGAYRSTVATVARG